ncbi:hypothetical protein KBZ14_14305 [Synechococcus sp. HJ21-Hayes]|uniref:hypothetical protein n=1 Tax=unclassified Synechococcus TaxID=2626047 RepID=UPI0020CB88F2|nr:MULTISPECIES: hypothetical protein [unclassified Synechococcus]MCP9832238.1 hypothetical protein [Synechococcus sp. JJ3a-Johnson]MCP9854028.1 hypothetical protein [Synechococcus sp. HJ21-Hayes]
MTDSRLESLARHYKASVAGRYRAIRPGDLQLIPHALCFVSRKIDGELWMAELHQGKACLFARGGRLIEKGPVLDALMSIAQGCPQPLVIAGELHVPAKGEARERVGDVAAALADGKQQSLAFAAFDVVELDGSAPPADYHQRLEILQRLVDSDDAHPISVVATEELQEPGELRSHVQNWVESGKAEGLVVRSSVGEIYKIKPSFSLDAVVVGFTTRASEPDQVRSLLLGLQRSDGSIQLLGACGNLPGETMRRELLADLLPLECPSSFRHSSSDGNLYRFVNPAVVLELSCTDLQSEDSSGDPIRRWALHHVAHEGWQPIVDAIAVSMIHPVVVRRRTDKQASALDVRVSQLQEVLPDLDPDAVLEPRELPRSTLIRRQVWSKAGKGGLAVRKLLLWKSGKDEAWPGWPAWVVHFTDYSPDRKTPLERIIRSALSEVEAQQIADSLIAENIKKGWEAVGTESEVQTDIPRAKKVSKPKDKKSASSAKTAKKSTNA